MYNNGQAVRRDDVEAYKWYCLAAAQGNTHAVTNRDNLLRSLTPEQIAEGQRLAADPKANLSLDSFSAPEQTQADVRAQAAAEFERDFFEKYPDLKAHESVVTAVALRFEANGYKGAGREAVMETFAKAARQELVLQEQAQPGAANQATTWFNLAVDYDKGNGVQQDFVQAAFWYRKASEQGNAFAQNNLGVMYQLGRGVPRDLTEAYKWYNLAAAQGYATALSNAQTLVHSLTPEQITDGSRRALLTGEEIRGAAAFGPRRSNNR